MKIGVAGYPVPSNVPPEDALAWSIREAHRLGIQIIHGHGRADQIDQLRRGRDLADSLGIEIEPYVDGAFDLSGNGGGTRKLREDLRAAKVLGAPYLRCGYGRLEITTSRFNPAISVRDHLARLATSLREAAKVAADEGVVLAIENHCDFSGSEIADLVGMVDSPALRVALDTGNSLTVFSDPTDDLRALAPLSVTTHLKDMKVIQSTTRGQVPFTVIGCALGQGFVDIPRTITTLIEQSPRGREIPLIIETGWILPSPNEELADALKRTLIESIAHLKDLLSRPGPWTASNEEGGPA